jgi:hypothetical protein
MVYDCVVDNFAVPEVTPPAPLPPLASPGPAEPAPPATIKYVIGNGKPLV